MNVFPRRTLFHRKSSSNIYRMFFWILLILGGVWLIRQVNQGKVGPLFLATPTPTRTAESYTLEGDAQFTTGHLDAAITAYQGAVSIDPNDAQVWAKLARIQAYSESLQTTDDQRRSRLQDALNSINQAVKLAPDDSTVHAIRAFVLDWNANTSLVGEQQAQDYLTEAEQEAVRARQLDNQNSLALAYYAEILVDQQKWTQADQYIKLALQGDPNSMDVQRVDAYVREAGGDYNGAIAAYNKATAIAPNLTFLYLRAGANYRRLGLDSPNEDNQRELYDKSLEYFAKAASINEQLGVKDPIPYLSIAKTYSQEGEFFIAARNVQKALEFRPNDPDIYGQLGVIYFKSRNYEGSIPTLKCAVQGCTPDESCLGRGLESCSDANPGVQVSGLALSPNTIDYYQVYFSVLAALGPRDPTYCPLAMNLISEVQASEYLSARPDIVANIAVAEQECAPSDQETTSPTSTPAATPTAIGSVTPPAGKANSTATPYP
jgi:tetratricopeptide (TPR) repeat protein